MKVDKDIINSLFEERKNLAIKIKEVGIAIEALQSLCDHPKWEHSGHDSHYNYEKCTICGKEEKA